MAKFLIIASYTSEGTKGLLKDGGSKRREVVTEAVKALGGTVEAFYYAFGDADAYAAVDFPDNISAAAISLAINAAGSVSVKLVVLMTPEEIDAATQKVVEYTAPGQ